MDLQKLISEIIPPSDYKHRNGFTNIPLLDSLNEQEKLQIEDALIYKLLYETDNDPDILIIETLAYLKSKKSLVILKDLMKKNINEMSKLIIATSIFEINQDNEMMDLALGSFNQISKINDSYSQYKIIDSFNYLVKFKNERVNRVIAEFIKHPEYLVSYNAKRVLGQL